MWTGVTKGLAGMKFSVSPSKNGEINERDVNSQIITINPNKSLNVK